MTKVIIEQIEASIKHPLNTFHISVYLDVTYIPVRREIVPKEAIYIAVGIREVSSEELLAYTID